MLYLHKLLPALFFPITITLCLVGAGLIWRKRCLCWSGLGLLYCCSTGVVSGKMLGWAEGAGFRREVEMIRPAMAIVVLSGGIKQIKNAPLGEWDGVEDRFEGGIEVFQCGKAPLLMFTGGHVPWRPEDRPEGEILKERAIKLGVPGEKIQVTRKVGNTADEAEAVMDLFRKSNLGFENFKYQSSDFEKAKKGTPSLRTSPHSGGASESGRGAAEGGRRESRQLALCRQQRTTLANRRQWAVAGKPRIILVTSALHMRRAKLLFERQGFEVEPFPVDFGIPDKHSTTILSFLPKAEHLEDSETAIREGIGYLYYTLLKR